jgi:hypothetical protein
LALSEYADHLAFPEHLKFAVEEGKSEEMARLHLIAQEALTDHGPNGCSDDRSG